MGREKPNEEKRLRERISELNRLALKIHTLHEEDRWAVSSDLHDKVLQVLNVAHLNAERCLRGELKDGKVCIEESAVRDLRALIAEAIEQTQDLMHELSSPVLKYLGLSAALKWLADNYSKSGRLKITVREQGIDTSSLPWDVKNLAFTAAKELIRSLDKVPDIDSLNITVSASVSGIVIRSGPFCAKQGWENELPSRLACIREGYRSFGGEFSITPDNDDASRNWISLKIPFPLNFSATE